MKTKTADNDKKNLQARRLPFEYLLTKAVARACSALYYRLRGRDNDYSFTAPTHLF
ncbi:MAG: hypothetical protein H0U54_09755 [Acidobacteria bacterium]|nr:hypothetical protein [Acidobacteriota bacterium]